MKLQFKPKNEAARIIPREIADCARNKRSQASNLMKVLRLPRVVVAFLCASIPLCFRQYRFADPYRQSRHLMLMSESPEYYHERELVALSVEKQQQKIDSEAFLNSAREITDLVKDQTQTNFTDAQVETPSSTKASTHSSLSSSSAIITPGIQQPKTTVNLFPSFPSATNDRDNEKPQNLDQEVTDSVKKPTQTNLNPLPSSVSTSKFRDVKKPMQEKKTGKTIKTLKAKPSSSSSSSVKVIKPKKPATSNVIPFIPSKLYPDAAKSMRACIFVRNDNHLLAEWIAYHYTVLPLRHLIIGVDENATDNPNDILMRWNGTGLKYEIWHPQNYTQNIKYKFEHPLHRFRQRQPHFMARCMQHFYKQGNRGWLALVDTDEYIKLNPLDDSLNKRYYFHKKKVDPKIVKETQRYMVNNETIWDRIKMRKQLRQRLGLEPKSGKRSSSKEATKIPTVLQVLEEYSSKHGTLSCHVMSRLRYSAVKDNYTALADQLCLPKLDSNVTESLSATKLSTVRFLYHAAPQNWKHNEWAKALIDLRRLPFSSLAKVANPHQPLKVCPGAYANDLISFIQTNHYINDLSVFAGRKGDTRQRKVEDWNKMAHLRDGVRCDQIHGWVNELVQTFGVKQAKHLLAHSLQQ